MPLLRRALDDAGYDYVPVLTNDDVDAHNAHPGFKLGLGPSIQIAYGLPMIDALEAMLSASVPAELEKGAADAAFDRALDEVIEGMERSGLRGRDGLQTRACDHGRRSVRPLEPASDRSHRGRVPAQFPSRRQPRDRALPRGQRARGYRGAHDRRDPQNLFLKHAQSREFHVDLSLPERPGTPRRTTCSSSRTTVATAWARRARSTSADAHARSSCARAIRSCTSTFDAGEGVLIPAEILEHAKRGCRNFVILQPFGVCPTMSWGAGSSMRS